jgi:hypothetical protein
MHDLADPPDAALGILRLTVPNAPVQTFDPGDGREADTDQTWRRSSDLTEYSARLRPAKPALGSVNTP